MNYTDVALNGATCPNCGIEIHDRIAKHKIHVFVRNMHYLYEGGEDKVEDSLQKCLAVVREREPTVKFDDIQWHRMGEAVHGSARIGEGEWWNTHHAGIYYHDPR